MMIKEHPMPTNAQEPLLSSQQRFTVYPVLWSDIWNQYKKQLAAIWTVEDVDMSQDRAQFNSDRVTDAERTFVKAVLTFFAGTDTVVSLNIMDNFCKEVKPIEAQIAYTFQAMMENIHAEMYSIMIETYITDEREKAALFDHLGDIPSVQKKVVWAQKWAGSSNEPFANRLVAFAIVEGLFFAGAFCAIYWFKQRNLLPGLTKSNEYIARDEGMHTEFACLLYSKLVDKVPADRVREMFQEAVAIEKEFIIESIPCRMIGMNSDMMSQYIEFVADGLMQLLGHERMYGSENPFDFMNLIGMPSRSNFFESRPTEYQRGGEAGELYVDQF